MTDLTNLPIFADADLAREHLESVLWPDGVTCPHCGVVRDGITAVNTTTKRKKPLAPGKKHRPARAGLYHCNACEEQFTVTVGTVMESSHIPLNKWLLAFYLMCSSKKGISAHQLHRTFGITYKSAWFMAHRIREALRTGGLAPPSPMGGPGKVVEADETFTGNLPDAAIRSGFHHKMAILTLVERRGRARSFHIPTANARSIMPIIYDNLADETKVMTDDAGYYGSHIRDYYEHQVVNHSKEEWARGDVHTNTVEGFFSIFKRGMRGIYQHCSEKHLHRYLAEFDFRYSNRSKLGVEDSERTDRALTGVQGKRLTYKRAYGPRP